MPKEVKEILPVIKQFKEDRPNFKLRSSKLSFSQITFPFILRSVSSILNSRVLFFP